VIKRVNNRDMKGIQEERQKEIRVRWLMLEMKILPAEFSNKITAIKIKKQWANICLEFTSQTCVLFIRDVSLVVEQKQCVIHRPNISYSFTEPWRQMVAKSNGNVTVYESSWNVMAQGKAREGKWRGNWRMEWVASTLHTSSEHGVSSITTADAQTSAASSRLNWRPRRFKWTRPFRRKTKSGFCPCHHISNAVYNPYCW